MERREFVTAASLGAVGTTAEALADSEAGGQPGGSALRILAVSAHPAVIALWLGHESVETTHGYVEADLTMMKNAMGKLAPAGSAPARFKASDDLLAFLATL